MNGHFDGHFDDHFGSRWYIFDGYATYTPMNKFYRYKWMATLVQHNDFTAQMDTLVSNGP